MCHSGQAPDMRRSRAIAMERSRHHLPEQRVLTLTTARCAAMASSARAGRAARLIRRSRLSSTSGFLRARRRA